MSKRNPLLYINDIIESAEAILSFTDSVEFDVFVGDRMRSSAVIREFEVIGEAVSKIPEDIKSNYPDIRWQEMKDFRNLLIHEYFGVDLEIVWNVVREDLPDLYRAIKQIRDDNE